MRNELDGLRAHEREHTKQLKEMKEALATVSRFDAGTADEFRAALSNSNCALDAGEKVLMRQLKETHDRVRGHKKKLTDELRDTQRRMAILETQNAALNWKLQKVQLADAPNKRKRQATHASRSDDVDTDGHVSENDEKPNTSSCVPSQGRMTRSRSRQPSSQTVDEHTFGNVRNGEHMTVTRSSSSEKEVILPGGFSVSSNNVTCAGRQGTVRVTKTASMFARGPCSMLNAFERRPSVLAPRMKTPPPVCILLD